MMVGSADSSDEEKAAAVMPLAATLVVGGAVGLASLAGLALYIAGLAGVASPRAEQYFLQRRAASGVLANAGRLYPPPVAGYGVGGYPPAASWSPPQPGQSGYPARPAGPPTP
jgi:hypothetical protein